MIRKFTLRTLLFIIILPVWGISQVQDLSYTLSPMGEYILWGDRAGLADGFAVGGQLGFGFGQYVELSGTYLQALNLRTSFNDYGIPDFSESLFSSREVNWQRYGGELRLNLSRGAVLPFITVGSGIQRTELIVDQSANILNEQIYIDMGAGVVLSMADRYTLSLSLKNNQYRFNSIRDLMTGSDRAALGIQVDDYGTEKIANWGLNASLQFYIGGRDPKKMTDIDKAYRNTFGNGLRGISVPIEPVAGKINFHDNLPYRNTWYAGGNIGVNLGAYIGLRGFYWRALKDEKFRDFDDLSLYGGEAKFNLNTGQGITPFLTIGGGYLSVKDSYIPRPGTIADNQPFAMGGGGLTLPLSPYFKLFGGVRAILLTQEDLDDLAQPGDVLTSWNYHFGMRLIIGQKAKKPGEIVQQNLSLELNEQQQIYEQAKIELEKKYDKRVALLEKQIDSLQGKQEESIYLTDQTKSRTEPEGRINLSPKELESLMRVITEYGLEMKHLDNERQWILSNERVERSFRSNRSRLSGMKWIDSTFENPFLDTLGQGVRLIPRSDSTFIWRRYQPIPFANYQNIEDGRNKDVRSKSVNEIDSPQKRMVENNLHKKEMENLKLQYERKISDLEMDLQRKEEDYEDQKFRNQELRKQLEAGLSDSTLMDYGIRKDSTFTGRIYYTGLSGVAGITFGRETMVTAGLRTNFGLRNSSFGFMTETYAGLGSKSILGIGINGFYKFRLAKEGSLSRVLPYAGLGIGLQQNAKATRLIGTYGTILGAELQMWNGRAFVDYTMRNIFDYNQVVLGYKFSF